MGGKMWVESVIREGTTFYFELPLHIVPEENHPVQLTVTKSDSGKMVEKNILVVEDEDSNYLLMETILKSCKANVFRANDGISAVEMIRKNGQHIDLILMDIKIPGINGFEATREIKKIKSTIPVIAQTAYAMAGEREKCLNAGCDDYIAKPIDRNNLINKINRFFS
jgi:CheY-like chemotaxis protein